MAFLATRFYGEPAGEVNLVGITRELYANGLEQSDEFEADRMGVVIAALAYQAARGPDRRGKTLHLSITPPAGTTRPTARLSIRGRSAKPSLGR